MIIREFEVRNYRSILNSGNINLDPNLTIFIGANESGKTSVLLALADIATSRYYVKDDLCTFSESYNELRSNKISEEKIEMIEMLFDLEKEDKDKLKKIYPKLGSMNVLKCTKKFSGDYYIHTPDMDLKELAKQKKAEEVNKNIKKAEKALYSFFKSYGSRLISKDLPLAKENFDEVVNDVVKTLQKGLNNYNLDNEYDKLRSFSPPENRNNSNLWTKRFNKLIDTIREYNLEIQKLEADDLYLFEDIYGVLPNFEYFQEYDEIKDSYNLDDFINNSKKFPTLEKLTELVGLDIENLKGANINQMIPELDHCSNILTNLFNEFWDQDDIIFNIRITDKEIAISIKDNLVNISQQMSMRSQGLQSVVSLFINVMSIPEHSIVILDDPGVHLHASGQKDILKMLEKLSDTRQIIISTHSPFLIDRTKLNRIRLVSKDKTKGTLISEKFHISNYDALESIRASIGMTLGDSLFTNKKNVLVEGLSDVFIIEAMSRFLFNNQEVHIDTSKISIFPVNSADKMPIYSTLLMKEKLDFIALLDNDQKGRRVAKQLEKKFDVDKSNILTLDMVSDSDPEKDLVIEDLINIEIYLKALNQTYDNIFKSKSWLPVQLDDLEENNLKGILKFFNEDKRGGFDKILVAKEFYNILIGDKESPNQETKNNFINLFKKINEKFNV